MTANSTNPPVPVRELAKQLLQEEAKGMPVWVRAPINGHEHFAGLTRAKLYELGLSQQLAFLRPPLGLECRSQRPPPNARQSTLVSPLDSMRWYHGNRPSKAVPTGLGDEPAIQAVWSKTTPVP